MEERSPWPGVIARYRPLIRLAPDAPVITLLEGNTPLIPAPRLAEALGLPCTLYLKYEGLNPTGSFKDRGMTVAVSQAVAEGARAVICASTGNTAASAAAYAARAGVRGIVVVPGGKIALGKLAASLAYGAQVLAIEGSFDDGLRLVREAVERYPVALVNSLNPYRLEGQKTAAFEVCDQLGDAPDWLVLPVGNAGNITAYWMGFTQYHAMGQIARLPRLLGVQAEGAAPLVRGHPIPHPETVATAIRIGNPARWREAAAALEESDGRVVAVPDEAILRTWSLLARTEGVFVEPASATGLAGLAQEVAAGRLSVQGQVIVAVLTGHGLKDPDTAMQRAGAPIPIPATLEAIAPYLEQGLEQAWKPESSS